MESEHQDTFVQYNNGIKTLYSMAVTYKAQKVDKDFAPQVIYIYGPPGSGKTRYVAQNEPNYYDVPPQDNYKWKDGYAGQDAVLYDNITNSTVTPTIFLKEIDRYFIQVPIKGAYIGWRPKRIYITSTQSPQQLATLGGFQDPQELLRRITEIKHLWSTFCK